MGHPSNPSKLHGSLDLDRGRVYAQVVNSLTKQIITTSMDTPEPSLRGRWQSTSSTRRANQRQSKGGHHLHPTCVRFRVRRIICPPLYFPHNCISAIVLGILSPAIPAPHWTVRILEYQALCHSNLRLRPHRIVACVPFLLVFSNTIGELHMSHFPCPLVAWQILENTHAECAF